MAVDVVDGTGTSGTDWSPARVFLAASAIYHLALGVAGLVINQTFPLGPDATERAASGHVFGIFETNGWHSSAALLLGIVSLYFAIRPRGARTAAMLIGVQHVAIVIAFFAWPPETFWFASNLADQFVHSFTAIAGIGSALLTSREQAISPS
mgnify:CR=1 FL=1